MMLNPRSFFIQLLGQLTTNSPKIPFWEIIKFIVISIFFQSTFRSSNSPSVYSSVLCDPREKRIWVVEAKKEIVKERKVCTLIRS